jgi:hypothetical protein
MSMFKLKGGENMTKAQLLIPVLALTLTGTVFLSVSGTASANTGNSGTLSSLVSKIADKLNLSETDVQTVLEVVLHEDQADVQAKLNAKLDEAVADGKITVAQKQSILDKVEELRTKFESMDWKDMTRSERREALRDLKEDLVDWAKTNDIDLDLLVEIGLSLGDDANANVSLSL